MAQYQFALLMPLALGMAFSVATILSASNQYTIVDGSLRCMQVYWHRAPLIGSNNHLLYPINVWLWSHLLRLIGIQARSPSGFLHTIAAMNAVCAGASVAVVNGLVWRLTRNWRSSVFAALACALSWGWLAHATSSAEPMAGLLASLLALLLTVEGLARGRLILVFGGGLCLALALANYESMFLVAPFAYLLCYLCPYNRLPGLLGRRPPMLNLVASLLGTLLGVSGIYSAAYYSLGLTKLHAMLSAFFRMGGEPAVYAGFSLSRLANVPVGLVGNVAAVLPSDYHGMRQLIVQHHFLTIVGLAGIGVLVAIELIAVVPSALRLLRRRFGNLAAVLLIAAPLLELFPLLYWDPVYNKLWLQPLALIAIGWGILACRADVNSRQAYGALLVLVLLEGAINLPRIVSAHVQPTLCLADASRIARLIGPNDRVVADFDPVSSLWMGFYDTTPARTLLFPATHATEGVSILDRWSRECRLAGCRIVFISLLDQPRDEWDAFLGNRLKVGFSSLDRFRQSGQEVDRFACEQAGLRIYHSAP